MRPDNLSPDEAWGLIEQYLTGDCTPEEAARARALIAEGRGGRFVQSVTAHLAANRPTADHIDAAVRRLREARQGRDGHTVSRTATQFSRPLDRTRGRGGPIRSRAQWGFIGAIVAAFGVAVWYGTQPSSAKRTASTEQVYATVTGQRAEVRLVDGTRVTLAPRSRLLIPTGFARDARTLVLDGEAYFDVAHVAGAPFIVRTGDVYTRVLGTAFNVRHYRPRDEVQVAVMSGKVATGWKNAAKTVTLTAGTVGRVTDSTATIVTTPDPTSYTTWTSGRLAFRNAPVPELLQTLGRWYGFDFRLADSTLAQLHVTTTLDNRTPQTVLRALALLLDVQLTFDGTVDGATIVTLHSNIRHALDTPSTGPKRLRPSTLTPHTEFGR